MEEQREAFLRKALPLAEGVHQGPGGPEQKLAFVEKLGRQRQQGLVRAVVVEQLRHLRHNTETGSTLPQAAEFLSSVYNTYTSIAPKRKEHIVFVEIEN